MHDHTKRGRRWCPLMQEWCTKGWTPKMGNGPDGFPIEGACAAWQPVTTFNIKENRNEEIHDCSAFGWMPDLTSAVAREVSHGAASTDKVATQVANHRRAFIGALSPEAQDRAIEASATPQIPPPEAPQP